MKHELILSGGLLPLFLNKKSGGRNKTPLAVRREIVKEAERIFKEKYAQERLNAVGGGSCVFWALATLEAGKKFGKNFIIQAGSLQWQYVPNHLDDGVSSTHFSYMWDPTNPLSRRALRMGMLPEVHVWVADPEAQEIIDLSTRGLKEQARNMGVTNWHTASPPRYFWVTLDEYNKHPHAHYEGQYEASVYVVTKLVRDGLLAPGSFNLKNRL